MVFLLKVIIIIGIWPIPFTHLKIYLPKNSLAYSALSFEKKKAVWHLFSVQDQDLN